MAKLCMLVYWNAGQPGFWDPEHDGSALDFKTPFGFEFLVASDPRALRAEVLRLFTPVEPALWLDPDPGMGPLSPAFATVEESRARVDAIASARRRGGKPWDDAKTDGSSETYRGVSRVAVIRLREPDWIVVCFRGTTPSPARGLLREGQINSMAGQETWTEAPDVMRDARVHRGYAAAYRSLLADVESAATDWARRSVSSPAGDAKPPPKVVVVGHSMGGALATLCAARLAHDEDIAHLGGSAVGSAVESAVGSAVESAVGSENTIPIVSCVTFGQPRVGDERFRIGLDDASPSLRYRRVVRGGDVFARVPTSGIWLPSSNGDQFGVEYAHAGSMVWTQEDGYDPVHARKGEGTPSGFNADIRMLNPLRAAGDHAGYAYFFEDENLKKNWPR